MAQAIRQYVIDLVNATRSSAELRLGASPRATLHLLRASRAYAALDGRDFVIPDDVQALAIPVLAHRLLPTAEALVGRELPEQVLAKIVERLPLPANRTSGPEKWPCARAGHRLERAAGGRKGRRCGRGSLR